MQKVNILMIYSAKGFGGIPRNLSLIAARLNPKKFNLSVAFLGEADDEAADIRNLMGSGRENLRSFSCLGRGRKFDFNVIRQIEKIVDQEKIDIVSCHGYKADVYGLLLKTVFRKKIKLFTIAHGWVSKGVKLEAYDLLDKLVMRFFDKIVLVSSGQKAEFGTHFVDSSKIEIINNAVDIQEFHCKQTSRALLSELALDPELKIIGFAGRLSPEKGIDRAIRIFAKFQELYSDSRLVIVGEGREEDRLKGLAMELAIDEKVLFLGYRSEMKAFYSLFDVYLSCSKREGLPNTVLEAMAAGVPCVLSDIPGHAEIVQNEENGYLVNTGDLDASAKVIFNLISNSSLMGQIKDEARRTLQKKFSIAKRIEKLEQAYLSIAPNRDIPVLTKVGTSSDG